MWRIVFLKERIRDFFRFIRRVPGYRKLDQNFGYEPDVYTFIIGEYEKVLSDLTGGKLSKPTYYADAGISEVEARYEEIYKENN